MEINNEDPRISELTRLQDENQHLFSEISQLKKQKRETDGAGCSDSMMTQSLQTVQNELKEAEQELGSAKKELEAFRATRIAKDKERSDLSAEIKDVLTPKLRGGLAQTTARLQALAQNLEELTDDQSTRLKELVAEILEKYEKVGSIESELTRVKHHISFQQSQVSFSPFELSPSNNNQTTHSNRKVIRRRSTNFIDPKQLFADKD